MFFVLVDFGKLFLSEKGVEGSWVPVSWRVSCGSDPYLHLVEKQHYVEYTPKEIKEDFVQVLTRVCLISCPFTMYYVDTDQILPLSAVSLPLHSLATRFQCGDFRSTMDISDTAVLLLAAAASVLSAAQGPG